MHRLTDELAADVGSLVDRLTERSVAIGFAVDARPDAVASAGSSLPAGRLTVEEATHELADALASMSVAARESSREPR